MSTASEDPRHFHFLELVADTQGLSQLEVAALMPGGLGLVATKSAISVWMKKLEGWVVERNDEKGIKRYYRGPKATGLARSQVIAAFKNERGVTRKRKGGARDHFLDR